MGFVSVTSPRRMVGKSSSNVTEISLVVNDRADGERKRPSN